MGVSWELFWSMNPRKISAFEKGHSIKSKIEDEQWWLRFREYGIVTTMIGVRNGVWGKDKVEYPKKPYLFEENEETENGNKESKEEIAVYEMKQRIKLLRESGLPESPD